MSNVFEPGYGQWIKLELDGLPIEIPYRDSTIRWAAKVNWRPVSGAALSLLDRGLLEDLDAVDQACARMKKRDREALLSLVFYPIDANSDQITNGIHRTSAMRGQGITTTVAFVPRDELATDVGIAR